jgi:hypothetical protein
VTHGPAHSRRYSPDQIAASKGLNGPRFHHTEHDVDSVSISVTLDQLDHDERADILRSLGYERQ